MSTCRGLGWLRRVGISAVWMVVAVMCLLLASPAQAQAVLRGTGLSFGSFLVAGPGFLTLSPFGMRSAKGRLVLHHAGAPAAPAQVVLVGTPSAAFSVSLPRNNQVRLVNANGARMEMRDFASNLRCQGVFSPAGLATVQVGATLAVNNSQDSGSYVGSFALSVDYE